MKLQVDQPQRLAKKRAHTATHLLHAALATYIPNTQQAGSLVDDDYLRFDFQSKDALTHHQIQEIEKQINTLIINAHTVKIEEMTYKNAISLGAKAFFEDKYGDIVRVVQILDGENMKNISLELCGGTHVSNTSEIGAFKILAQEAVASGIRRIVAVTGPQVAFSYQETQHQIELIAQKLECTPKQLDEKIDKTIKQIHVLQSENEKMLARQIDMALEKLAVTKIVQGVECYDLSTHEILSTIALKTILPFVKTKRNAKGEYLLYTQDGGYALVSSHNSAKQLQQKIGIQGGGNDSLVQGKDLKILSL